MKTNIKIMWKWALWGGAIGFLISLASAVYFFPEPDFPTGQQPPHDLRWFLARTVLITGAEVVNWVYHCSTSFGEVREMLVHHFEFALQLAAVSADTILGLVFGALAGAIRGTMKG
jgi:hypothetical protein